MRRKRSYTRIIHGAEKTQPCDQLALTQRNTGAISRQNKVYELIVATFACKSLIECDNNFAVKFSCFSILFHVLIGRFWTKFVMHRWKGKVKKNWSRAFSTCHPIRSLWDFLAQPLNSCWNKSARNDLLFMTARGSCWLRFVVFCCDIRADKMWDK